MVSFFESRIIDSAERIDSVKTCIYWKSGYYDSIPKAEIVNNDIRHPFSEMVAQYQTKDFEYVESISNKLNFLDKLFYTIKKFISDLFPSPPGDFNEGLFNLLAVIGGLIVIFLIYKFFVSRKQVYIKHELEADVEQQIDFVERNLMEVDVKTYLAEAVEQKNYALAIRYHQLTNIQLLGRKGVLQWDQSKTNLELMENVKNNDLRQDFMHCASLYNYAWFGNFDISESSYQKYAGQFVQFQRRWS